MVSRRLASSFVLLVAAVSLAIVIVPISAARATVDSTADAQCTPVNTKCGCGEVPDQKTGKCRKVQGKEKNMHKCECKSSVKPAGGYCRAEKDCKGTWYTDQNGKKQSIDSKASEKDVAQKIGSLPDSSPDQPIPSTSQQIPSVDALKEDLVRAKSEAAQYENALRTAGSGNPDETAPLERALAEAQATEADTLQKLKELAGIDQRVNPEDAIRAKQIELDSQQLTPEVLAQQQRLQDVADAMREAGVEEQDPNDQVNKPEQTFGNPNEHPKEPEKQTTLLGEIGCKIFGICPAQAAPPLKTATLYYPGGCNVGADPGCSPDIEGGKIGSRNNYIDRNTATVAAGLKSGLNFGDIVKITNPLTGKSTYAIVGDVCPACGSGMDLTPRVLNQLGNYGQVNGEGMNVEIISRGNSWTSGLARVNDYNAAQLSGIGSRYQNSSPSTPLVYYDAFGSAYRSPDAAIAADIGIRASEFYARESAVNVSNTGAEFDANLVPITPNWEALYVNPGPIDPRFDTGEGRLAENSPPTVPPTVNNSPPPSDQNGQTRSLLGNTRGLGLNKPTEIPIDTSIQASQSVRDTQARESAIEAANERFADIEDSAAQAYAYVVEQVQRAEEIAANIRDEIAVHTYPIVEEYKGIAERVMSGFYEPPPSLSNIEIPDAPPEILPTTQSSQRSEEAALTATYHGASEKALERSAAKESLEQDVVRITAEEKQREENYLIQKFQEYDRERQAEEKNAQENEKQYGLESYTKYVIDGLKQLAKTTADSFDYAAEYWADFTEKLAEAEKALTEVDANGQTPKTDVPSSAIVSDQQGERRFPVKGEDATTLDEWYEPRGGLPPRSVRGERFDKLNTGEVYTGTARQNDLLLGALKGDALRESQTSPQTTNESSAEPVQALLNENSMPRNVTPSQDQFNADLVPISEKSDLKTEPVTPSLLERLYEEGKAAFQDALAGLLPKEEIPEIKTVSDQQVPIENGQYFDPSRDPGGLGELPKQPEETQPVSEQPVKEAADQTQPEKDAADADAREGQRRLQEQTAQRTVAEQAAAETKKLLNGLLEKLTSGGKVLSGVLAGLQVPPPEEKVVEPVQQEEPPRAEGQVGKVQQAEQMEEGEKGRAVKALPNTKAIATKEAVATKAPVTKAPAATSAVQNALAVVGQFKPNMSEESFDALKTKAISAARAVARTYPADSYAQIAPNYIAGMSRDSVTPELVRALKNYINRMGK